MAETPDKKVIRDTDDASIELAKRLIHTARHGALAVSGGADGYPQVSRVQLSTDTDGALVTLVSSLSPHTQAMIDQPRASILVGEAGKGDPLAHPRITCFVTASQVARGTDDHARLRHRHLHRHPKAALYADFGDFSFFRLSITGASLNGGFGKAYNLTQNDLTMAGDIDGLRAMEASAVAHMNDDHSDAVALYAEQIAGAKSANWSIATIDPEGMTMVAGDAVARVPFPRPLASADDLRAVLALMAKQARAAQKEARS